MANQIQIKRSTETRQPPALTFGEQAYTTNGNILWIGQDAGDTANVIAIGGERVPGVLTANQAIVVDGNLFIDTLKVGNSTVNAVMNSTSVKVMNSTSNGVFSIPTAAQWGGNFFLHANGEWATPAAAAEPAGSNTHVQFNDSGSAGGTAGLTFNQVSNTLAVSNTLTVPIIGGTSVNHTANAAFAANLVASGAVSNLNSTSVFINATTATVTAATTNLNGTTVAHGANATFAANVTTSGALTSLNGTTVAHGANATFAANVTTSGALTTLAGTSTAVSSNASFTANVVTSGAVTNVSSTTNYINGTNLTVGANAAFNANVTILGNLIVNGTTATINVDTITVEDSIIKLASNNLTTNTIDIGLYGVYGNSSVTQYTGIFRDTSNSGIWTVFRDLEPEPGTTVDTGNTSFALGTLLSNFTTGSAFSANSTKVTILAGALVNDLDVSDGGTGRGTITTNGIMYGNTTGPVGITGAGTEGQVFQAGASGVPVFAMLDGGTF